MIFDQKCAGFEGKLTTFDVFLMGFDMVFHLF